MDTRFIDIIALYEEATGVPENERSTRFSKRWNTYIVKNEMMEKAREVEAVALKAIGKSEADFAFDENYADKEYIRAAVYKATRPQRIAKEKFQVVEIFDKPVLFTCERLQKADIPEGLYKYDIRHDDDCQGDMAQLKNYVMVNHWGTVICKEPFEITQEYGGNVYTTADGIDMTEDDYNYTSDEMTIDEYINSYDELLNGINQDVEQTADEMGGMSMG